MAKPADKQAAGAAQTWPNPNPALKELQVLSGAWVMELSNAAFLPSGTASVKGHVGFEWIDDGAFLEMRQGAEPPNPMSAAWLIGRDEGAEEYRVLYYDARGVSRIYRMSFDGTVWKMWRDAPGFSQRFTGEIRKDGRHIHARWEKSSDGKTWEHDFDMDYTRIEA
jgi:hypothetical protein